MKISNPFRTLFAVAPSNVTKSAAEEGSNEAASRADHKHDITTAVAGASAALDTVSEGVATSLARSDHRHSRAGVFDTLATQAQVEAETAGVVVPASLVRNSPGVAKAWCRIDSPGALESPSYNIASVTDTGPGLRTIVIATDFSSTVWVATGAPSPTPVAGFAWGYEAPGIGNVVLHIQNAGVNTDLQMGTAMFGDQ